MVSARSLQATGFSTATTLDELMKIVKTDHRKYIKKLYIDRPSAVHATSRSVYRLQYRECSLDGVIQNHPKLFPLRYESVNK